MAFPAHSEGNICIQVIWGLMMDGADGGGELGSHAQAASLPVTEDTCALIENQKCYET